MGVRDEEAKLAQVLVYSRAFASVTLLKTPTTQTGHSVSTFQVRKPRFSE